jgi:hypothetical protein
MRKGKEQETVEKLILKSPTLGTRSPVGFANKTDGG